MNITIRQETPGDYRNTENVVREAFAKLTFSDQDEQESGVLSEIRVPERKQVGDPRAIRSIR